MRLRCVLALVTAPIAIAGAAVALTASPAAAAATPVLSHRTIGYSVKHRPIVAYRLGNPYARTTAVILGEMHGDEPAGVTVVNTIVHGGVSVEGINLWVIPTMNPDGYAAHTRGNAHHVDLNRNWPRLWVHLYGQYYSGPKPLSEPETRAMYNFLRSIRPKYLVSLHQPLHGVDTTDGGAVDKAFRNRLAQNLGYPLKAFRCWSICHGSMTDWYTVHYAIGETIEFGAHPTRAFLTGRARTGIVAAMGGHFGRLSAHNPHSYLAGRAASGGSTRLTGYAYDIDSRATSVRFSVTRDGTGIGHGVASAPSPATNAKYHLTGAHGISFTTTAGPGRHTFCLTFTNIGAGTGNSRRCVTVTVPPPPSPASTPPVTA